MWYMNDVGWGWWLLMSLGMVGFWSLVLFGIVWLARGGARTPSQQPETESPGEVLKRRLATGEISVEEYEQRRRALDASGPAAREP